MNDDKFFLVVLLVATVVMSLYAGYSSQRRQPSTLKYLLKDVRTTFRVTTLIALFFLTGTYLEGNLLLGLKYLCIGLFLFCMSFLGPFAVGVLFQAMCPKKPTGSV